MDSYKVFRSIVDKYVIAHANFVGHNPIVSKPVIATYLCILLWYSFSLTTIYTVFTAKLEDAILNVFLWFYSTQGLTKSYVTLTNRTERKKALDFLGNLYKANEFNNENRRILSKCVQWNLLITKIITLIVFTSCSACVCFPLAISLITGRMEPIFPTHIPFVPTDKLWGYAIYCVYFSIALATAYAGTVGNEVLLMTSTIHIWAMYKILEQTVNGLNQATESLQNETVKYSSWLHWRVRNILLIHKEIYFYVKDMSRVNYRIFTNELYSDQWSLIILIYVIFVLKWPPAILLFLMVFTKLLMYCIIGTAVEILNDRIYNTLVDIDCVMLPPNEQKLVLFLINQAQHPPSLSAGLDPLNMMTFLKVLKTIYTFTMALIEFA